LRFLTPVLKKWISLNKSVAKAWQNNDVPWWYGERACLSILAGAIWKSGGIAFEEYSFEKRKKRRSKHRVNGRNDLYFMWKGAEFIVEAKYSSFGASKIQEEPNEGIQECLENAREDVRKCSAPGQRRLAVAFVRPYFPISQKNKISQNLEKWINNLKKVNYSCAAWVFPKDSRYFKGNYYGPGIAILIKEVHRA
jgi:hypothetical protein